MASGASSSSPPNYSCGNGVMMATPVVLSGLGVGIAPPAQKHVVCQRLTRTCNRMARYMGVSRNLLSLLLRVTGRTMLACRSERDCVGLTSTSMKIVDSMFVVTPSVSALLQRACAGRGYQQQTLSRTFRFQVVDQLCDQIPLHKLIVTAVSLRGLTACNVCQKPRRYSQQYKILANIFYCLPA